VRVDLDPRAGPVRGDPDRLQQVVWNLLSNAIKFTPDGGRVDVTLRRDTEHVVLGVADNGIGIPPEFLPYVFDRFRQADGSTTRPQGGLGLGLAIVRHLAEVHGGEVSAYSEGPGRGAKFIVKLPLVDAAERDEAQPTHAVLRPAAFAGPSLEGVTVLLVDFDQDAAAATGGLLRERGAEVTQAFSPGQALEIVRRLRPDVLLARGNAESDECHQLIRAVREIPPERGGLTPAAVFDASGATQERMKSLLAGFQAHLTGPVAGADLVTVVASLAGRTRELL
jgi:CheY-like chemotaxis protein